MRSDLYKKKDVYKLLSKAEDYLAQKKIDYYEAKIDFNLGNSGLTEENINLWNRDIEVMAHFMATLYELAEEV